jgi:hypothetical protein
MFCGDLLIAISSHVNSHQFTYSVKHICPFKIFNLIYNFFPRNWIIMPYLLCWYVWCCYRKATESHKLHKSHIDFLLTSSVFVLQSTSLHYVYRTRVMITLRLLYTCHHSVFVMCPPTFYYKSWSPTKYYIINIYNPHKQRKLNCLKLMYLKLNCLKLMYLKLNCPKLMYLKLNCLKFTMFYFRKWWRILHVFVPLSFTWLNIIILYL